jgi:hypothetical protein
MQKFYDVNHFPNKDGLIVFPISMSRISNSQSGDKYLDFLKYFEDKLVKKNNGVAFIYTDNLYYRYHQENEASQYKYLDLMTSHKNLFMKHVRTKTIYVESAFSFTSWIQLCLESVGYLQSLAKLKKLYDKDKEFQKYVKTDIENLKREVTENNVDFVLEETLMTYLLLKKSVNLKNTLTNDREEWRLLAYPGKPNRSFIYFFQNDIFKLKSRNHFENCVYDLNDKTLYDLTKIDLDSWE